jgi:hypothetical protein
MSTAILTFFSSKRSVAVGKSAFAVLWVVAVVGVLLALNLEDRYFSVAGKSVAKMSQVNREVTVRSEDDLRWRPIKVKQGIYDGDKVATGPASEATIDFGEGRKGIVGPDSVVAISTIRQKDGNSFILNLIKGGIKPIVPKNSRSQLIVTSGTSTFYVEPGEAKGFAKPVGGTIRQFSSRERFPVVVTKSSTPPPAPVAQKFILPVSLVQVVEKLPAVEVQKIPPPKPIPVEPPPVVEQVAAVEPEVSEVASPEMVATPAVVASPEVVASPSPIATPVASPAVVAPAAPVESPIIASVSPVPSAAPLKAVEEVKPVAEQPKAVEKTIDASSSLPSIEEGSIPGDLYTLSSLKDVTGVVAKIAVKANPKAPASAIHGLEVQIGSLKTKVNATQNRVAIQIAKGQLSANASSGEIPCAEIKIRGMVVVSDHGKQTDAIQSNGKIFKVCSLGDVAGKAPLSISLTNLAAPSSSTDVFKAPTAAQNYGFQFQLLNSGDVRKILPYVRSATGFKIAKGQALAPTGVFGVTMGKAVAQFSGSGFTPTIYDNIMKTMGYSMVYKGSSKALYDASKLNPEQFQNWISENTSEGKKVYIPMRGNLVPISRDFMSQRTEVAEFVQRSSKTLVTEKIEIITYQAEK